MYKKVESILNNSLTLVMGDNCFNSLEIFIFFFINMQLWVPKNHCAKMNQIRLLQNVFKLIIHALIPLKFTSINDVIKDIHMKKIYT